MGTLVRQVKTSALSRAAQVETLALSRAALGVASRRGVGHREESFRMERRVDHETTSPAGNVGPWAPRVWRAPVTTPFSAQEGRNPQ